MVREKARTSPTLDLDGNHHPLCACILCLTGIEPIRKGRGNLQKKRHGNMQGKREGKWRVKIAPRNVVEEKGIREALVRSGERLQDGPQSRTVGL